MYTRNAPAFGGQRSFASLAPGAFHLGMQTARSHLARAPYNTGREAATPGSNACGVGTLGGQSTWFRQQACPQPPATPHPQKWEPGGALTVRKSFSTQQIRPPRTFSLRFLAGCIMCRSRCRETGGGGSQSSRGGIGRRVRLRTVWGNPWRFESSREHHLFQNEMVRARMAPLARRSREQMQREGPFSPLCPFYAEGSSADRL